MKNPYSALAAWFKTDEGVASLQNNSEKVTIICDYNYSEGSLRWPLSLLTKILKWQ